MPWPGNGVPDRPPFPDGVEGSWGWIIAAYMGVVDGVPQHVGELYAMTGWQSNGLDFVEGDWSLPGHLFSSRSPATPMQPPFPNPDA